MLIGIFFVNKYGRRKLFMVGWASMTLVLGTIILSVALKQSVLVLGCFCSFQFIWNSTMGAIHWFYYPEVLTDV